MADLTAVQIRYRIEKYFPQLRTDPVQQRLVADYAAIGEYLAQGPERIRDSLLMLESRMGDRLLRNLGWRQRVWDWCFNHGHSPRTLARRQFAASNQRAQQQAEGVRPGKIAAYSHLLTDELAALETKAGYNLFDDGTGHLRAVLIFPLNADGFRNQIDQGRPMKDPTIGVDHGEYAHRLQWYAIVEERVVADPLAAYKGLAKVPWSTDPRFGLWDDLLDRQPLGAPGLPQPFPFYKADDHDFRCPEALTTWLCQEEQQRMFPLLAGFIKARKEKRQYQVDNKLLIDYVARKIHNKGEAQLSEQELVVVLDAMGGGLAQSDHGAALAQKGVLKPNAPGRYAPM